MLPYILVLCTQSVIFYSNSNTVNPGDYLITESLFVSVTHFKHCMYTTAAHFAIRAAAALLYLLPMGGSHTETVLGDGVSWCDGECLNSEIIVNLKKHIISSLIVQLKRSNCEVRTSNWKTVMFSVCLCVCFQAELKTSHLHSQLWNLKFRFLWYSQVTKLERVK